MKKFTLVLIDQIETLQPWIISTDDLNETISKILEANYDLGTNPEEPIEERAETIVTSLLEHGGWNEEAGDGAYAIVLIDNSIDYKLEGEEPC